MLTFTEHELELLGKTADALSAYMGKPVLAEVDVSEDGFEWVMFGVPLDVNNEADEEMVQIQMAGPSARLLGNAGGLNDWQQEVYACEFLWGIQLTDQENIRFIRIDYTGEEVQWTETLEEMLPFAINDEDLSIDDEDWDDEDDDDEGPDNTPPAPTLH